MIYSRKECIDIYGSDYYINKAITVEKLYRVERDIYSDSRYYSELGIINKKYSHAIFTLNSAFYYQGLSDTIPERYHLITDKDATKIKDKRVKQYFDNSNSMEMGVETMVFEGTEIRIFTKERLLVELIRYRNKMSFDYYKEIVNKYRSIINTLNIGAIQEYVELLPKSDMVYQTLLREVF